MGIVAALQPDDASRGVVDDAEPERAAPIGLLGEGVVEDHLGLRLVDLPDHPQRAFGDPGDGDRDLGRGRARGHESCGENGAGDSERPAHLRRVAGASEKRRSPRANTPSADLAFLSLPRELSRSTELSAIPAGSWEREARLPQGAAIFRRRPGAHCGRVAQRAAGTSDRLPGLSSIAANLAPTGRYL
jgi:hypothetical protein